MEMQAHHENIREAAERYSEAIVAYHNATELGHEVEDAAYESYLDVEVWRKADGATGVDVRVEYLLACGGPTVRVVVDMARERVEFFHSWGYSVVNEREQNSIVMWSGSPEAQAWLAYAEMTDVMT